MGRLGRELETLKSEKDDWMSEKDVLVTEKAAVEMRALAMETRASKSDEEVVKLKQLSEKLLRDKQQQQQQQVLAIENSTASTGALGAAGVAGVGVVKPTVVSVSVDATATNVASTSTVATDTETDHDHDHDPPPLPLPLHSPPHTTHTHLPQHYRDRDLATIAELNERIEALSAMKTSSHKKIAELGQQALLHQGMVERAPTQPTHPLTHATHH